MLMYLLFLICFGASSAMTPLFMQHPHLLATGQTAILLHCSATDDGFSPPTVTWVSRMLNLQSWSHVDGNVTHSYTIVNSHTNIGHLYCQARSHQNKRVLKNSDKIEILKEHFTCGGSFKSNRFHLLLVMVLLTTCFVVAILILYAFYIVKYPSATTEDSCNTVSAAVQKTDKAPHAKQFNNLKFMLTSLKEVKGNNYRRFSNTSDA